MLIPTTIILIGLVLHLAAFSNLTTFAGRFLAGGLIFFALFALDKEVICNTIRFAILNPNLRWIIIAVIYSSLGARVAHKVKPQPRGEL